MKTPKGRPVTVLLEIAVRPGHEDAFIEAVRVNAAQRRAAPGCVQVDVYQSDVDPTLFTMVEAFLDQTAIDAYYATAHHAQWMESIRGLVTSMRGADQRPIVRA